MLYSFYDNIISYVIYGIISCIWVGFTFLTFVNVENYTSKDVIYKKENICFSGDVLFYNSIGRTDLPGGDHDTLINSIKNKLFLLNPNTIIYPGHGQKTILKNEMKDNPFLI